MNAIEIPAEDWTIEQADQTYGVSRWGKGYFHVGENGDIMVTPNTSQPSLRINLREIVDEMQESNIQVPAVIRFHDILRSQVEYLNKRFAATIEEAEYQGSYFGVFPIKVNQMREVVEEIVDAGAPFNYGLEAGSKPELMAALAHNSNENALTILNGYKDEEYLRLALLGQQIGRNMVIVIEKFSELRLLVPLIQETGVKPIIGLRCKLSVKGKGKWEHSTGERAKFGLTYVELMRAVAYLEEAGLKDLIKLLHFHLGSQLPDIRPLKEGVQEAAMVYVNMLRMDVPVSYIDVGGGLAIDYDGTRSSNSSSCNYSFDEYIADVVYGFKQACDQHDMPHPNLVSESGRA
ncbi:MAG: biosynthetic arginine decarboxylase, partial [Alphaproteobacteria bacterium]|nr:biosynthetic arginine decarboxylase [Alphaproteobacteria bacterium]